MSKFGRNAPCPCGSGKKYKNCHLGKEDDPGRPPHVLHSLETESTPYPATVPLPKAPNFFEDFIDDPNQPIEKIMERVIAAAKAEMQEDLRNDSANPTSNFLADLIGAKSPRERVKLARKAIESIPDCSEAYLVLAEDLAKSAHESIPYFREAMAIGERIIGPEAIELLDEEIWDHPEFETYLAARSGLARALHETGDDDEAISHFQELLQLDPEDANLVRDPLLCALMKRERNDEALQLVRDFADDLSAYWTYAQTLLKFRLYGPSIFAERLLRLALAFNPTAVDYLLGHIRLPETRPFEYFPGDESEAILIGIDQQSIWSMTPGALDWLASIVSGTEPTYPDLYGNGPLYHLSPLASQFIHCPKCDNKTKPRRQHVGMLIEPDELIAIRAPFRFCEQCNLALLTMSELAPRIEEAFEQRGDQWQSEDAVPVGIIDPVATKESKAIDLFDRQWIESHLERFSGPIFFQLEPEELEEQLKDVPPDILDFLRPFGSEGAW